MRDFIRGFVSVFATDARTAGALAGYVVLVLGLTVAMVGFAALLAKVGP